MLQTFKKATSNTLLEIAEEKKVRKTSELFLLFSMGSQFDHLIKQKLDALGIFCLVADPASVKVNDVKKIAPIGIIISGGPASAYEQPPFDGKIFDLGIPVLGVCLGFQMLAHHIGVKVSLSSKREFGTHTFHRSLPIPPLGEGAPMDIGADEGLKLFDSLPKSFKVLETHGDIIHKNKKLNILGSTENTPVAAGQYKHLFGVQFHPEVTETEYGDKIYENFCFKICGAKDRFPASEVAKNKINELKQKIGNKKVLLALSGGTDSSVVAYLLKKSLSAQPSRLPSPSAMADGGQVALSPRILGIYIKGIDRPDDENNVIKYFGREPWIKIKIVDATDQFLAVLKGKISMRDKRLAIRSVYKKILEQEAKKFGASFIAQGTLYTDISESGGGYESGAKKAQIKIHHNVNLKFSLPEIQPLGDCVKDTARNLGKNLGVPNILINRHPFPGPGLVVRIEGEVTKEKLHTARKVDKIYIEEMRKWKTQSDSPPFKEPVLSLSKEGARACPVLDTGGGYTFLYDTIWQAGAVVTASNITCSKGDDSAYGHVIALWAMWSVNGFTARSAELPYQFLKHVSQRITNEVREVGGVVYRISDKPPVTIEWG